MNLRERTSEERRLLAAVGRATEHVDQCRSDREAAHAALMAARLASEAAQETFDRARIHLADAKAALREWRRRWGREVFDDDTRGQDAQGTSRAEPKADLRTHAIKLDEIDRVRLAGIIDWHREGEFGTTINESDAVRIALRVVSNSPLPFSSWNAFTA